MGPKNGWVWIPGDKGKWRPFLEFRQIVKGKNGGMIEVTLSATPEKKVIVSKEAIRSYPVNPGQQLDMVEYATKLATGPQQPPLAGQDQGKEGEA